MKEPVNRSNCKVMISIRRDEVHVYAPNHFVLRCFYDPIVTQLCDSIKIKTIQQPAAPRRHIIMTPVSDELISRIKDLRTKWYNYCQG